MNLFTLTLDLIKTGSDGGSVKWRNIFGKLSSSLSLEKRSLTPQIHDLNHLADILFHLFDEFINIGDNLHSLVDKRINVLRVPLESINTWLESLIHRLNTSHHQGLLNWEEGCDNVIVHLDNKVKTSSPSSVSINFAEKAISTIRNLNIKDLKIFDFTKVSHEDRVEVDTNEAFFSKLCFFTD